MAAPPIRMNRFNADLILLAAAAIWGCAFVFQKSAMAHIGPLTFIAARSALAAVALAPLAWREQARAGEPMPRGLLAIACGGGLLFFVAAWLQQAGIRTATVTNTGFLTALYVVITPFIAWGVNGKTPNAAVWPAVAMSAVGTWLLGGGGLGVLSQGDTLVALSAAFWAAHVVITGRASQFGRPVTFTAIQFGVVTALAGVALLPLETVTLAGLSAAAVDIAYLGLLSSALAFTMMSLALRHTPPSEAAIIASFETVFAATAAYLVLGERLGAVGWAGAALILAAILFVQLAATLAPRWRWH